MKLNKLIAALSAVTMIGSLAVVPAMATDDDTVMVPTILYQSSENTTWKYWEPQNADTDRFAMVGDTKLEKRNDIGVGSTITLTSNDNEIVQARIQDSSVSLNSNTQYTVSVRYEIDLTGHGTYDTNNSTNGAYVNLCATGIKQIINTTTLQNATMSSTTPYHAEGTYTFTITPTSSTTLDMQLYLRRVTGTVTYSDVKITYMAPAVDTENISITANSNKTLYQGDTIDITATVEPYNAAPATISFSSPKMNGQEPVMENGSVVMEDVTHRFVDNGDGSYTYNYNGRCGDSTGAVTVTATSGEKAATTTIYTQRLRNMSYNITNKTGEDSVPGFTVKATVNGETKYDEDVKMGSRQHTANSYSGNSVYKMEFTVPEGYKLELNTTIDGIIIDGNTAYTNDDTDINSDFYVTGTLTKESSTHTSDYFKFNYTADTQLTFKTVTLNATRETETKEASTDLKSEITLEEGASGIFYMNVTNVPDDVKINSITLN